jgi:hypothetical protein
MDQTIFDIFMSWNTEKGYIFPNDKALIDEALHFFWLGQGLQPILLSLVSTPF